MHPIQVTNSCLLSEGDKLACTLSKLTGAFGGEALFGLLMAGAIFIALFVAGDGDMATPTVVLILTGGVLVPMLPAGYQQIAYSLVVVGVAAGALRIAQRYFLSGVTQ